MLGKRVQVYFNLHKKCFSVRCKKTRKVIAYLNNIYLEDVTYKVSEAGRKRVLKEKQKNVHAFIEGTIIKPFEALTSDLKPVTYNPYCYPSFVTRSDERAIYGSNRAILRCENKKPITMAV